MKNILQEIHERSLWQVLGIYLATSWVVLQVVDTLNSTLGIPEWVIEASFVLLLVGLPIVMVTAFVQKGWSRRAAAEGDGSMAAGRRLFTWRNAIVGGVCAFAALGIGTTAWLGMRVAGIGPAGTLLAKGVLDERGLILLADLDNSTDDPFLADVVTEALRVDLSQSEAVRLADPGFVADALGRMQRPDEPRLTEELAREIAEREGIKAVVTGDVARAGAGYVLSASVVKPDDGEILVSHRESARDSTALLDAIDGLSHHLRERIGDPLGALAATPPLAQVTTANLEALRAYSQARRLPYAESERHIALLEQALARDSTFAMAWNALAIAFGNYGTEPGRVMNARSRAFALRDRLTEKERNAVAGHYYTGVTNEPRLAIPYLEALIEADPLNSGPVNNLGEAYRNLGDLETALELYHRSVGMDSAVAAIPLMNIAQVNGTLGNEEQIEAASALLDVRAPPFGEWHRAMAAGVNRDYGAAEERTRATRDAVQGSPFLLTQVTQWLANVVMIQGRVTEGAELWDAAVTLAEETGSPVEALRNSVALAVSKALTRGEGGTEELASGLARFPLEDMDPVERPYLDVAEAYALIGDPEAARRLVEEFETTTPEDFQRGFRYQRHRVLGEIARGERRFDDAIAEFRQSGYRPQELEPMVQLARSFDAAGQADSARVHYRRFLESPHWLSITPHAKFLAHALERAAELEYEAGNLDLAAAYYAEFVELWEDADPELQPRVQAARLRLEQILRDRG